MNTKYKSDYDRYSTRRLLKRFRMHTIIADALTGVAERREIGCYKPRRREHFPKRLVKKLGYLSERFSSYFSVCDHDIDITERHSRSGTHPSVGGYVTEGPADAIMNSLDEVRTWSTKGYNSEAQFLRYKNGRAKLTVRSESMYSFVD